MNVLGSLLDINVTSHLMPDFMTSRWGLAAVAKFLASLCSPFHVMAIAWPGLGHFGLFGFVLGVLTLLDMFRCFWTVLDTFLGYMT